MPNGVNHKDRRRRRIVSERPCLLCGAKPCDPHHYPLRRSQGGHDTFDNMVPLCHPHHRMFHDGEEWVIEAVGVAAPLYFGSLNV